MPEKLNKRIMTIALLASASFLSLSTFAHHGPQHPPGDRPLPGERPPGGERPPQERPEQDRPERERPSIVTPETAEGMLQTLVTDLELQPANIEGKDLPSINDPVAQLGKHLFFAKNLGGEGSAACASCHHPTLGGGDGLSLPVGVNAVNEFNETNHDLLGPGRFNGDDENLKPVVPRNSPSIFNIGLNERALFWDGRVERLRNDRIVTPDSSLNEDGRRLPDSNLPSDASLAAAQARFPVTSNEEMRDGFSSSSDNQALRALLAQRFDNSQATYQSSWPNLFSSAFGDAEINFDRIAEAIGEYERSMVFVNNAWFSYLNGNENALSDEQKAGAVLFFTRRDQGGAGCVSCHNGETLISNRPHLVAFPQIGPGKGNASSTNTSTDFGRENITGDLSYRFHFRAPSLLNIAATSPYGHAGAYQSLTEVVRHYNNPRAEVDRLFGVDDGIAFADGDAPFCNLPQVADLQRASNQTCASLFPDAYQNSIDAVSHLEAVQRGEQDARSPFRGRQRLNEDQINWVVSFLHSLTDPCVQSRDCLSPWIIDGSDRAFYPDDNPLIGIDRNGNEL